MKKMNIVMAALVVGSAALGVGTAVASNDPAASGKVLSASGGVLIQRSVRTDTASTGSVVGVGDTVLTTDTGVSQVQMSDDSYFAIAPSSGLKINKFALPTRGQPGIASYTLLQGSVHTITGRIGKTVAANTPRNFYSAATTKFNPANLIKVVAAPTGPYTLKTAIAVITASGADYVASQTDNVLKVLVNSGSVMACTVAGCASPGAGEGIVVSCAGCKPSVVSRANLALDSVLANLQFDSKDMSKVVTGQQVTDSRNEVVSPTQACRTVASILQDGVRCGPKASTGDITPPPTPPTPPVPPVPVPPIPVPPVPVSPN